MMWKHWGTPPAVGGPYTSGFEEEFSLSVNRRENSGKPEIGLFFKEIASEFIGDPGDHLKKVLAFKDRLIAEKKLLFENFSDTRDFEGKIRRCVTKYVQKLRAAEVGEVSEQSQVEPAEGGLKNADQLMTTGAQTPLSVEGAKFLREFISKTERDLQKEPITAADVARSRLLSHLVGTRENDQGPLGVHDANLLFKERSNFNFGRRELEGLLANGLQQYRTEVVPLWSWYAALNGFVEEELPLYSFFGPTNQRVGTLAAMRLILQRDTFQHRKIIVESWFSKGTDSAIRVAALLYLGDLGTVADLPVIQAELSQHDSQTTNAAIESLVRINLRQDKETAIRTLYELQPSAVSADLLTSLFDGKTKASDELLLSGIGHRNARVRAIVTKLLRQNRALPTETAEQLTSDSDVSVRLQALISLISDGRALPDSDAEKIIKKNASGVSGFFGAEQATEACWKEFRQARFSAMSDKELETAAALEDSIHDFSARFALIERQFSKRGDDLRRSVDNQFKVEFEQDIEALAEKFGSQSSLIESRRSVETIIRRSLTRQGLNIICRHGNIGDLKRVRETLASEFVDYSHADIEYLRKFGEWKDIPLMVQSLDRPDHRNVSVLVVDSDEAKYETAARAIYSMGRHRFSELITLSTPGKLQSYLIAKASDATFRTLSGSSLLTLLSSENEKVRKATALKCVKALSKKKVAKLLAGYISGPKQRYYNVVHWLDLGASAPKEVSISAAARTLLNEWRG
jgi:hypothetical protein